MYGSTIGISTQDISEKIDLNISRHWKNPSQYILIIDRDILITVDRDISITGDRDLSITTYRDISV
jgi:hypothetical protein